VSRRLKAALLLLAAGGLLVFLLLADKPPLREGLSLSQAVYDADGKLLRLTLSDDDKYRLWLPLESFSPLLVKGTLIHEDRYFRWHPGVNPVSVLRAAWETYIKKDRRLGASTVTMQLARIRYGINTSGIGGKLRQMLKALKLEAHYSKDEILEAYLNLAPYGLNIEGAGAASLIYFDKRVSELSLEEALALSVLPQSPGSRMPLSTKGFADKGSPLFESRMVLFEEWVNEYPEDEEQRALFAFPIALRMPSLMPFRVPHLVQNVLDADRGRTHEITTTVSLPLQGLLERVASKYIERKRSIGIRNLSAMLLDYRTMEVKAYLGSVDFFDDGIQGQVDGASALRSPGSTVKPFIYSLALERGLVHTMTMIKDSPTSFGAYSPENFDSKFIGPIKVKDALVRSRNIPALHMAEMLEPEGIYEFLRKAGIDHLREKSFYGLAIAMGGAELTMKDLVELYAVFPNGGEFRRLRTRTDEKYGEGQPLLSPEASYITMEMLRENPRANESFPSGWKAASIPVHWKTGTSFSFRDAWAIGIFGPYVLAVWVGNFDGSGNPAFVGRDAAGPVFFNILDAIKARGVERVYNDIPMNIKLVEVCSVSGRMPTKYCGRKIKTMFIPGTSPIERCDIHREVIIDKRTGLRACNKGPHTTDEVYEFWPSDILKIFRLAGIPRRTPPPYEPGCSVDNAAAGLPPKIISPQRQVEYTMRASVREPEGIPFSAVTDADAPNVHWFVDEKYLGSSDSKGIFLWPPSPGKYIVRAVDDMGRSDSRDLTVTVVE
jgi:penicillin-binding protein 1C